MLILLLGSSISLALMGRRCTTSLSLTRGNLRLCKFVSDEFITLLPRDSTFGLTPSGPAQALFKTVNRFVLQLELFRVYINIL
jgi:hypothetical protein